MLSHVPVYSPQNMLHMLVPQLSVDGSFKSTALSWLCRQVFQLALKLQAALATKHLPGWLSASHTLHVIDMYLEVASPLSKTQVESRTLQQ